MKHSLKYLVLGWQHFEHLNAESGLFKNIEQATDDHHVMANKSTYETRKELFCHEN